MKLGEEMRCPKCRVPMTAFPAPPASTVYQCRTPDCPHATVYDPTSNN